MYDTAVTHVIINCAAKIIINTISNQFPIQNVNCTKKSVLIFKYLRFQINKYKSETDLVGRFH